MLRSISIHVARPGLQVDARKIDAAIAALDAEARRFRGGCPAGELSLAFFTDRALADLHGRFLDDPSETDVITFEGEPDLGQAGEICVSADAALRCAGPRGFSRELTLYVVHGWLHLAGYDDLKPALKRVMRRAESRAMEVLARHRLLGAFSLTAVASKAQKPGRRR